MRNALVGFAIAGYLAQAQKQLTGPRGLVNRVVPTRADVVCEAEWLAYNAASTAYAPAVVHYTWTILTEQWATWDDQTPMTAYIGEGLNGQPCKGCEGSSLRPLDHTPECRKEA